MSFLSESKGSNFCGGPTMRTTTTAALSLLACAILALPQASFAGKPDRNPSEKDCPFADLGTSCSVALKEAYDLLGALIGNNADVPTFLSSNPERDAGTLQCKTSGAEIKLAQDKADEAWYLMETAKDKVESLFAQSKLSWDGRNMLLASFQAAQDCIPSP